MSINSRDIKKSDFKRSLRGYDSNEVDAFLETLSNHYEKLLNENRNLTDQVKSLISDVEVYKENEQTLQKAIVKAQDLADEIIENAKKKGDLIRKEAEIEAKEYRQVLETELLERKQELEDLKSRNDRLIEDVKIFIADKLNEFDEFVKRKRILRMELTSSATNEEKPESTDTNIKTIDEQPANEEALKQEAMKRYNSRQSPFDDNFEVK
ncbi:MAG: DivIVA domain-containing protein [Ignavibacteriaceae bacterium]|jgi:cell division initiation protein|nr:MAG: DivIVA domain-containing protein [Chlorobiota bacterium]KXK02383.1 MAG: DivIVA family protein [Chlorobi bacterium OLB4]MBV6397983.1 Cell cycle protein GpsB [Ignavibacteria bacterium]MCC6886430.1 DivIVA domain-containing protein [Ignavibacteriales bacterium]MCE7952494.1 DivIVA domain-containing protein [Chlorobi bacterium CHB7]MDL1886610.1 DivIVA domain-containing protein [Ignavibacteria bacterium CHB1]MEB2329671.1 DivIVA domain-containing protein [Ignavibacteriaceae bacterium]OQY7728